MGEFLILFFVGLLVVCGVGAAKKPDNDEVSGVFKMKVPRK